MIWHRHRKCGILCLCKKNVFYKSELTELFRVRDTSCPKGKKMEQRKSLTTRKLYVEEDYYEYS